LAWLKVKLQQPDMPMGNVDIDQAQANLLIVSKLAGDDANELKEAQALRNVISAKSKESLKEIMIESHGGSPERFENWLFAKASVVDDDVRLVYKAITSVYTVIKAMTVSPANNTKNTGVEQKRTKTKEIMPMVYQTIKALRRMAKAAEQLTWSTWLMANKIAHLPMTLGIFKGIATMLHGKTPKEWKPVGGGQTMGYERRHSGQWSDKGGKDTQQKGGSSWSDRQKGGRKSWNDDWKNQGSKDDWKKGGNTWKKDSDWKSGGSGNAWSGPDEQEKKKHIEEYTKWLPKWAGKLPKPPTMAGLSSGFVAEGRKQGKLQETAAKIVLSAVCFNCAIQGQISKDHKTKDCTKFECQFECSRCPGQTHWIKDCPNKNN